jgi:hypothetical protein
MAYNFCFLFLSSNEYFSLFCFSDDASYGWIRNICFCLPCLDLNNHFLTNDNNNHKYICIWIIVLHPSVFFFFLQRQTVTESALWTQEQLWWWENRLSRIYICCCEEVYPTVCVFFLFAQLSLLPPPIFLLLLFIRFLFCLSRMFFSSYSATDILVRSVFSTFVLLFIFPSNFFLDC